MEKQIDLSSWKRKEIFDFFSHASNPYYMVTFRIDVAPLYAYVKEHHLSFYYSLSICAPRRLMKWMHSDIP